MSSLKVLNYYFGQLKEAYKWPRLHVTNFFDNLKRKVDIAFNTKIESAADDIEIQTAIITAQYKQVIAKIEAYEQECFSKHESLITENIKRQVEDSIKLIETNLATYVVDKEKENLKQSDDEDDGDESSNESGEDSNHNNSFLYSDDDYKKEYDFGYDSYSELCFKRFRYM